MMMIIICSIIGLIAAALLINPVKLKFRFRDQEKKIKLVYLLFRIELDFTKMNGIVCIDGVTIVRFPFQRKAKKIKPKIATKKKKRFNFSQFKTKYLKLAGQLLGHTQINELQIKVRGGFAEPFYTGKIYGYYWFAKGVYPNLMSHVDFHPDFASGTLTFDSRGYLSMRLIYIVLFLMKIGYDLVSDKAKNLLTIKERRAGYVQ